MDREQLEKLWDEVARGPMEHFPGIEDVLGSVADCCDDNSWEPDEVAALLRGVATDLNKLADAVGSNDPQ